MSVLLALIGFAVVLLVLWDAFETIVVPKTVERRFRVSSLHYRMVWRLWHLVVGRSRGVGLRQAALMSFGPLSLIFLFVAWATVLVFGFALVHMGVGDLGALGSFAHYMYYSGVTFFTLGYGDMVAVSELGRFIAVAEAGTGFGFLAIVISYIPILYQAFSRRERFIVMMDARMGSVPSAGEAIKRFGGDGAARSLREFLHDAEKWSAEQLENYLSYPILAYYRSQHETQSWLAATTAVLDTCAVVLAGVDDEEAWERELMFQAKSTFAMARHVIVDLAYVLGDPPAEEAPGRLTANDVVALRHGVDAAFGSVRTDFEARLREFTEMYEPYLVGLARDLRFVLPAWTAEGGALDNWQQTAWNDTSHF